MNFQTPIKSGIYALTNLFNIRKYNTRRKYKLSDIILLEFANKLQEAIPLIEEGKDISPIVSPIKEDMPDPNYYRTMVERISQSQFSGSYKWARELQQNSLDSYAGTGKRQRVRSNYDGEKFELEDFGRGMGLEGVLRNLLVPFKTTKEESPEQRGEHGVGWYDLLGHFSTIQVKTSPNGLGYNIKIFKDADGEWYVMPRKAATKYSGTKITLPSASDLDSKTLESELENQVGWVSSADADIIHNGKKVNVRDREYALAAEAPVEGGGVVRLYAKERPKQTEETEKYDPEFILTQGGLTVGDNQYLVTAHLGNGEIEIFTNSTRHAGQSIWIDTPLNTPLNIGRTGIAAYEERGKAIISSIDEAVFRYVIHVLSDDALVKKIDTRHLDFLDNGIDAIVSAALQGKTIDQTLEVLPMHNIPFGVRLFTQPLIERYDTTTHERAIVTIPQFAAEYVRGNTAFSEQEGKPYHVKREGLVEVLAKIIDRKLLQKALSSDSGKEDDEKPFYITAADLEAHVQKTCQGQEYKIALQIWDYLVSLMAESNNMARAEARLYLQGDKSLAHHNLEKDVIGLNLYNGYSVFVEQIRNGSIPDTMLFELIDSAAHETTHQRLKQSDHGSHGDNFWEVELPKTIDSFMLYAERRGIDYAAKIQGLVSAYKGNPITTNELVTGLKNK